MTFEIFAGVLGAAELDFNSGWKFFRGSAASWSDPSFDDKAWRNVETPHDWSIEALPPRSADSSTPVLAVRTGTWAFTEGVGNTSFADPAFDDSAWQRVQFPADWHTYGVKSSNATGWFRRRINVTAADMEALSHGQLRLALGTVYDSDVTYVNGVVVGSIMASPHESKMGNDCKAKLTYRSYGSETNMSSIREHGRTGETGKLAAALKLGENLVAVQVHSISTDPTTPGGIVDTGAKDVRVGAFDAAASPGQRQTGYAVGGVGIYRKTFTTPADSAHTEVYFEGCYMNCQVVLNGKELGTHPYGYSSFSYDISSLLAPASGTNVLAVKVNNSGVNSRWYSGSGLYRKVSLLTAPAVHLATWGGVYVTTPSIRDVTRVAREDGKGAASMVAAETDVHTALLVTNSGNASAEMTAKVSIVQQSARVVSGASTLLVVGAASSAPVVIAAGASANISVLLPAIANMSLWGPGHPQLYSAQISITSSSAASATNVTDTATQTFGVRSFSFDAATGFTINGEGMKLYGGCVHHDNGPLGSKAIAAAEERRVQLLKNNGYNAIRTSHNPVSRAFVQACEKLGVLLMEEAFDCWDQGKNLDDYHLYFHDWWRRDVASMVLRDRNSPAIIMWSIGNEIPDKTTPVGISLSKAISDYIRVLDPSPVGTKRAVTSAFNGIGKKGEGQNTDAYLAPLDVAGYNYDYHSFAADHARVPGRVIVGTETYPAQTATYWAKTWENTFVIGNFIWTAIDYIGESAIGANGYNSPDETACSEYCAQPFPYHISFCGDIDIVGGQKPQAYYRKVLWNVSQLEMAVHAPVPSGSKEAIAPWGWPDERQSWTWDGSVGTELLIRVFSTDACVQLFLNGKPVANSMPVANSKLYAHGTADQHSAGPSCQSTNLNNSFTAEYHAPYEPGELMAVSYNAAGAVQRNVTFVTAKAASKLRLVADRVSIGASRDELAYIVAEVVDDNGVLVTCANEHPSSKCIPPVVTFEITSGAAELAAVGSGDPIDPSSFAEPKRKTYRGRATAIIRPGAMGMGAVPAGQIVVRAVSPGLEPATITIDVSN
jgi:beta-galactosidase